MPCGGGLAGFHEYLERRESGSTILSIGYENSDYRACVEDERGAGL
jgi:hypothetical protein